MRDGAGWVGLRQCARKRPPMAGSGKILYLRPTLNPGTDETNTPPCLNCMLIFSL